MRTADCPARTASSALSEDTTSRNRSSASARTTVPGTPRSDPSSPSSPRNAMPSTRSGSSAPDATSTPMAIGRSSPAPPLRSPDGARFTVTRRRGQLRPLDKRAARTRSRDSRTAASGRPTTVNPGRPFETWTSTNTMVPSTPERTAEGIAAIMTPPIGGARTGAGPIRLDGRTDPVAAGRWREEGRPQHRLQWRRTPDAPRHATGRVSQRPTAVSAP